MEKLQRFSIRKLSIGAVSCLIGTVSFLSYSYRVQAAEAPQTVETAKAENEIRSEKAQESKQDEEAKGGIQNAVVDTNTVGSQRTSAVTTVDQASPKENVPTANEAAKANEAAVINKVETNKEANKLNGEGNETGSVDTTVFKTNTASKESKQNIADLAISTKMKLQAIRLAKPVQTVSPEQPADTTDAQPASDQSESVAANSNAPENDVHVASVSTVLSKQPANTDTQPTATTSGVQPFVNLAVESDNNDLTPKHETIDSQWTIHYVNQADHKQELKDPTVITMQYTRTNTPQSDGKIQYGDWSYVPDSFKQTGTPITVKDSNNPVKQDNVDKNGENFDVFTITAMYPTVAGYGFYNGINGTRLRDNLRNNERQADAMSKDFYAEYDVAKPTQETVGSQWRIHYIDSTNHEHELKAPTVINMQYVRTNTPQSDGTIQHGDWSYVPGSFKLTGTPITVNDSDNPVKDDNVARDGKNEDVFTINAMYPTITGYNFHNGISSTRLHDHLLNYDPNGNIQMPTMGQDFYVEYDPISERSVAVKFVDDQSYDFNTSDHKKQVGQAVTVTGRDGDTVNLKLTVPDKYQLANGQQLPTTYTFAKGSGDLKIHLVHKVVQREATIDVQLLLTTSVHTSDDAYAAGTITQARWKQLEEQFGDEIKHGPGGPDSMLAVDPSVKAGTLTGHVDYDLVDERVTSLGDDWTTLNLGGKTYQLPNGDEVVNGIMIDGDTTWGKSFKEENLKLAQELAPMAHADLDPDYVNRPWHGYLSVNATNNDDNGFIDVVRSMGLQAGLVGDEPNALAKATGDHAATAVEMANKNIDLSLLQNFDFYPRDISEQNGRLQGTLPVMVVGVYIPYVEKTATRTINVTTPDGKTTAVKQTTTLAKQVDFGKDAHPAWTTGEWASYEVPTIPGYTASQSNVAKEAVTGMTKDQTVNITYTANDGTQTIVYQDEDGSEIGKQIISGKTDEKVKITSDVPDGYVLKGEVPSEVTIKPDDTPITVTVEHGRSHVTPDKPVNKGDLIDGTKDKHYPEGLTHDDLNKTITREVIITDPSGKKTTSVQTVTFTRGATVDEVTGKVIYDSWSEGGKHTFDKIDVPTVQGYLASGDVPSIVVTPETQSSKVDITYIADAQHMLITYVDDTTGKTLKQDKLDGTSDQDTKYTTVDSIKQYTDLNYKLVSDSTNGKDLIFDRDDNRDQVFEVHFVHGTHAISDKKSITETITYTMSDGSKAPNKVKNQVEFNRVGKHDDVTNTDTWDEWQPNKQSFSEVPTPEVKGYTPDLKSVDTKTVRAGDKDITVTVTYSPDKQKAKVVFIDDTTKKILDTHDLIGVTNSHKKYNPSDEIEKFIHDNYVFVSSDYPEKGFTYDNDDSKDQVFEVHFKERPTESDTPIIPDNTEDNGGSNDTSTDSDEPEKDNGGSDTMDKSGHKTPVKRNSNKKHHGTKKINNQKNANKNHQGTKKINNQKTSKTAKLNPNGVNTKANKPVQTKLGKVQEPTNDTLPQTGNKQSGLIAALGLAISSLGMIGAVKSKKRKDNQ